MRLTKGINKIYFCGKEAGYVRAERDKVERWGRVSEEPAIQSGIVYRSA